MSLDSAKSKMIKLKKQLEITYRTSTNEEQKKRVANQIKKLDHDIAGYGDFDEEIDLDAMDFIADIVDQDNQEDDFAGNGENSLFSSKIDIEHISGKAKDEEMDEIYSYLFYFHRNFYSVLQPDITRLDRKSSGKMEDAFLHYNHIQKYLTEYKEDVAMMENLSGEKELESYCRRLERQKNNIIIKLNKVFIEFQTLLSELTEDDALYKLLLNPSDLFNNKPSLPFFSSYEGQAIYDILTECIRFIGEYRKILRAPEVRL